MDPFSVDFGALGTRARSTCESAWLDVLHHRPVKELPPSSRRIISCRRLRARAWSSWYVTFFDGARHAEGSDVERYGAWERTEEEGRIRRRPWRTRGGEGEAGRDARYLRIQIKSPGRHVGEKKSGVVYRSSSYLTARQRNLLSTLSIPSVSRGCNRTRSFDRRTEPMDVIHIVVSSIRIFYIYNIQVCMCSFIHT